MRQLHHGAQRHLPQVRDVRRDDGVLMSVSNGDATPPLAENESSAEMTVPTKERAQRRSVPNSNMAGSIIQAVAWPLAVIIICLIFRHPLTKAIEEVSRGELYLNRSGGIRVELEKLATTTSEATQKVPAPSNS
jgi:hypothetical protein